MKYQDVVKKAQENKREGSKKVPFQECKSWLKGNQINLWTYWQGYQLKDIDEEDVDILLVGQDWGNPKNNSNVMKQIEQIQAGKDVAYDSKSPTDVTMARMFKAFGENVNIMDKDPGLRLFFTNYCLGYRAGSETCGMTKTIMRQERQVSSMKICWLNRTNMRFMHAKYG